MTVVSTKEWGERVKKKMEPDIIGDVAAFHRKFGVPMAAAPRGSVPEDYKFRDRFMQEELDEWRTASINLEFILGQKDLDQARVSQYLEDKLDALLDLTYVVVGTALMEFPEEVVREGWRRVQAANMAKARAKSAEHSRAETGRGHRNDVIKPSGWKKPDHSDLVANNIYAGQK